MLKKFFKASFTSLLLLPVFSVLYSQAGNIKLRHLEGFKSIKAGSTINIDNKENTNTFFLGYNHYLKKNIFVGFDILFESGTIEYSSVKNINLAPYICYTVLELQNTFFLNGTAGLIAGRESAESNVINDIGPKNSFIGGGFIGINLEIFVNNTWCIEPFFYQYMQAGSNMGSAFYNKGLSLKYNF
ncbi:MAG: hypothetical protein JXB34_02830 [Bacteroidales bacterium]|nr:hypothetical protein [Bacteroidales bacterium]